MLVFVKGAGDIATGIATRLYRSGFSVIMTDINEPTCVRRTVCFSEAIRLGSYTVEGIEAVFVGGNTEDVIKTVKSGKIAVMVDPDGNSISTLHPDVVVDAILAKENLGTKKTDAPIVIAVGPGFEAGVDCHAVVETKRGHTLGRVIYSGTALPNTGVPGNIGGYTVERVLRAPCDGTITLCKRISDLVNAGDTVAYVNGEPVKAQINGVLRGLLAEGTHVIKGMKSGDIDPRGNVDHCFTCSDKALAIGGGVLEAIMHFSNRNVTGENEK